MREIKFRAWNKIYNKMIEVDQIDFFKGFIYYQEHDQFERYQLKDCELMQFIKLKDKNNKEIYEGDIIEVAFQMNPKDKIEISLEVIEDIRNIPRLKGSSREPEVIGNIYENPKLLDVTLN